MSELGTIGQMYEDRRTKKKGKLIERDEKYKTLLLESEDGKSFNVSYGGFKGNWRSVDEPVETIEEAMQEVDTSKEDIPEQTTEEKKEEKPAKIVKKRAERNISEGYESAYHRVSEYAKSFNNPALIVDVLPNKRKVLLKFNNRKIFIINYLTRSDEYRVCVSEKLIMRLKDKKYVNSIILHDKWINTKYTFIMTPDALDKFFEDVKSYVIDFMCDEVNVKEEE